MSWKNFQTPCAQILLGPCALSIIFVGPSCLDMDVGLSVYQALVPLKKIPMRLYTWETFVNHMLYVSRAQ